MARIKRSALSRVRKNVLFKRVSGFFLGRGQRMLATDQGEYPLLETRRIVLQHPPTQGEEPHHG